MFAGLFLDGSGWATCPNPDITGDLTVVVELWKEAWDVTAQDFVTVWFVPGGADERSWILGQLETDDLAFRYSTDGTSGTVNTESAPIPDEFKTNDFCALKVEFDSDPGTITFYAAESKAGPWTELDEVNLGSVTTLHSSTADLKVGGSSGDSHFGAVENSVVKAVEVYAGISTGIEVDARFDEETRGTTSFTDAEENTWTLSNNAAIVDGQTPNLALWVPDATDIAKEWAVTEETSRLNAEAIDSYIGDLEFNEQDAVIDNSNNDGPFDVDGSQRVKWVQIGDIVFAWWDIDFGNDQDIAALGFVEIELPVAADTSFHTADNPLGRGDLLGEGILYRSQTSDDRILASVQLRDSGKVRINLDTDSGQRQLTGDDPWVPDSSDSWAFNAIYKAA